MKLKLKNKGFYYAWSRINGVVYLQIWQKSPDKIGKGKYIRTCGTAEKLNESLVQLEKYRTSTKEINEKITKIEEQEKE